MGCDATLAATGFTAVEPAVNFLFFFFFVLVAGAGEGVVSAKTMPVSIVAARSSGNRARARMVIVVSVKYPYTIGETAENCSWSVTTRPEEHRAADSMAS